MKKTLIAFVLWWALLLAGCGNATTTTTATTDTANDSIAKLATCIKDSWAKFYGTTRCSHCNDQKSKFGDSKTLLPFIDCDQNWPTCDAAGVKWYPTWVFANWSKLEWSQDLATLAAKTSCTAPQS